MAISNCHEYPIFMQHHTTDSQGFIDFIDRLHERRIDPGRNRKSMWLVMDGVAGTGEPAVWKSAKGVSWQVSIVTNLNLICTWRV